MVFRVEDDALGGGLRRDRLECVLVSVTRALAVSSHTLRVSSALDMLPRQLGDGLVGRNDGSSVH